MKAIGEDEFVIIQNDFGHNLGEAQIRLKCPVGITWEEFHSGTGVSTMVSSFIHEEFYLYGKSGKWGYYAANDSPLYYPLRLYAFLPEYEDFFQKHLHTDTVEWQLKIKESLPKRYKKALDWLIS